MQEFYSKLRKLGQDYTQDTVNLENTRLAQKYLIFDLLAVGKHSTIYYGIEEVTGKERVFKLYNLRELENTRSFKEKELCKRLSNYEYSLARKCSSIHVLNYFDVYEDRNSKIIVSEYCNLGPLSAEIAARKGRRMDQLKAIAILKQVVSALSNIHNQCGILHKNLKAKNILIQDGIYKLIDFGLPPLNSQEQEEDVVRVPEIIMKKGYDQKAEVWNVGLLFHEILYGERPRAVVHCSKNYLISSEVKSLLEGNQTRSEHYSGEVIDFLEQCLQTHPQDRMTWQQLVGHPIFQLIIPSPPKNMPCPSLKAHDSDRMSVIIAISQDDEPQRNMPELQQQNLAQLQIEQNVGFYEQMFNLERETKALEKQLEQSYEKLGHYLELKGLEPASWEALRRGINRKEHAQYQQLKNYYLQCLKVDFVYYDLIQIIKQIPHFEESREHVEFLYLIFSRCFFEMSQLQVITQNGSFSSRSQSILIACIKRQTQTLYTQVKNDWEKICSKMKSLEDQIINRVFDKLNKFINSSEYKRKVQLLSGIEGPDFSKQEQIRFTMSLYNEHIRKQLGHEKYFNQQLLVKLLDKYEQMWNVKTVEEPFMSVRDQMLSLCQIK